MSQYADTPFEQFAQNATGTSATLSGTTITGATSMFPSGMGSVGGIESPLIAYGLLVLGAAGMGALVATYAAKRPSRRGPALQGAMLQGGLAATVTGAFGTALPVAVRATFGAVGVGALAGAYFTSRR